MPVIANLRLATTPGDLATLSHALVSERGESSGVAIAKLILASYGAFPAEGRLDYLKILASDFAPDAARLARVIDKYREKPGPETASALFEASEPPRQELIRRLNLAPGGTERLVRMREDVLANLRAVPALKAVDSDFVHLLSSWFNRGFLQMRPIDWTTPAHILEKVMRYEAVHEISDWGDLRRRLEPGDRRCFAFFHPALPDEPLIFVEVALTASIPQDIGPLLAEGRKPLAPAKARTAVFYSISTCQVGLKGISFGNFLIKQVAEELKRGIPSLRTFVTLSPVPGFTAWLKSEKAAANPSFLRASDRKAAAILEQADWSSDAGAVKRVRPFLHAAVAHYFLNAKTEAGKPVDAVARFHLGNGASLERIDWMGDTSRKGIKQSAGFMVNYRYDLADVESNHEAYARRGEVVASAAVRSLLRKSPKN